METSLCLQGLIILMLYFVTSTASRNNVSSPDDLTFGLKGMFQLFWEWKPSNTNCSNYSKNMSSLKNERQMKEEGKSTSGQYEIFKLKWFDPNDKISLRAKCIDNTMPESTESLNRTIQLAPGDEETAVNNFHCVWHYQEHVKCTWQPGPKTSPNTTYRIFYWVEDTSNENRQYTQAELWDLFETGRTCELFSTNDLNTVGCQFLLNYITITNHNQLAMVVTDASKSIKPYIYYTHANYIAKFKPPTIIQANRTSHNIYVSWNKSQDTEETEYELLLTSANGHTESYNITQRSMTLSVLPDDTYTIKVRVKLSHILLFDDDHFIWSDWSKETIFPGKDNNRLTSIIVPLISAVVIIAAVILLVHMKTLKAFICPQIPDPARIFPKDFQQWLKSDVYNVYNKPEKEEICPVFLIESHPTTKCV
ncbi:interleukin-13 receptor subunit alpha-1-like [Lithobates pipiens]